MNAQDREDLKELTGEFRGFVKEWNTKRESDAKFHGVVETQIGTLKDEQGKLRTRSNIFDGVIALGTLAILYIQSRVKIL